MPHLVRLHGALAPEGLSILAVHTRPGTEEDRAEIRSEAASFGIPFPVLLADEGTEEAYGITAIPSRLLLDRQGRILSRSLGFSEESAAALEDEVRRALAGPR